ncbi:hypothetical protein JRQ81_019787 [Phrynocephalus forsythii]|uniref:Uncharacterized protein n=1 Tax=Phrynocephalus forsythii TaxID=171643 RepID=A0A9Q0XMJ0_9SAUR|nr:hypothetical protein JRQ81_019787 [Phrynocephalus forsythii]
MLFGSDGVKCVWWQPGEDYKDKCVMPTFKHVSGSIVVWGCMSAASSELLQFIEGTMNANMYCDMLKQSMILSLQRLGQHDNNPKHLQNDQHLAKQAEGQDDGMAKCVSRPKPY